MVRQWLGTAGGMAQNKTYFNISSSSYNKINCLHSKEGFSSSSNAPIIDGDWRSSVPINSSFLLQVYRLCKPPSASVMWGLQWHAHNERWSSALQQVAALGQWELPGISGCEKTEVQVPRTAACMRAWWQWSTGLEQPSCWWIVDSPSQWGRIHLCWDKWRNLMENDRNKGWDYCLASVSSRGKRMRYDSVARLVIYVQHNRDIKYVPRLVLECRQQRKN